MRTKAFLVLLLVAGALGQTPPSFMIRGHIHRLAQPRFDRGRVSDLFQLNHVTMMFKPSPEQQADLNTLLEQQQDPSSPNYRQWLTPEEFADRFGLSNTEFDRVTNWLQERGFTIDDRAPSRNWVAFSGTARQMDSAFKVRIHEYVVNGETHYASITEPSVPASFGSRVLGLRSLHNFRPKSRLVKRRFTSSVTGNHFVVPDDWATIYDVHALYNSNITGAGQKIAVMGVSDIELPDIETFRSLSGLPPSTPRIILNPGSPDPGIVDGDVIEASMDIEWSGAVARDASIIYVIDANDPFNALQYAIAQNLAPVMSISYGACEAEWTATDRNSLVAMTQQANSQGITISVASGDAGAADCDLGSTAELGLAVDLPAALPYVTAVGGTEFNEAGNVWSPNQNFGGLLGKGQSGIYWSPANNGSNGSALSYIPEIAWNDTLIDSELSATGGGKSSIFPKPSWQVFPGVPNDSARDVPDISVSASADNDGYLACVQGSCANGFRAADGSLFVVGGTSIGAPTFSGVVALINQMTNSPQGNVNPVLYRIANSNRPVFHDTLQSGNQVPCFLGSLNCPSSGFEGFAAAPGYDLTTGLGSIDVSKLLQVWTQSAP
jgi:subtilase family serine protease